MVSEYHEMFGNGYPYLFENIIDHCPIPKVLLPLQIVDEEGLVLLDVLPGLEVREALRVEAD